MTNSLPSDSREFSAFESDVELGVWYVGNDSTAFLRVEIGVGNPRRIAECAAAGLNALYRSGGGGK